MKTTVQVTFLYDSEQPVDFGPLQDFLERISKTGAAVGVETLAVETDQQSSPTPAGAAARPRGRPRRPNGTEDKAEDKDKVEDRGMRVSGGQVTAPVDLGSSTDDEDEDIGLQEPTLSDHELKERALGIIRNVHQVKQGDKAFTAEMREMQRTFGVTKFYDIPDQDGPKFYKLAVAVAEKLGMRP